MNVVVPALILFSVLTPQKTWFAPDQPININVKADGDVNLVLTDFGGRIIEAKQPALVSGSKTVDIKPMFAELTTTPGTYILYAVPPDADDPARQFVGTPLVIGVREDRRQGAPPGVMIIKVEPLCFVMLETDKGVMSIALYYDVAPHTAANFLALAQSGFYDGLTFHRIVPDFVIQGGDPRGDGTGGPGYMIDAEFNERHHDPGVLSMARSGDPDEAGGAMPRGEFANSAGSQFFICLNYQNTMQLDRRYTAFARVIGEKDAMLAIAAVPLADAASGRPQQPPRIIKAHVKPVTAAGPLLSCW